MHLLKNIFLIAFVSLLFVSTLAQDTQKRNSLLSKQIGNRKNIFQKSTTTTTTEAAVHEDGDAEYADEEYVDEEIDHVSSSTTSTTTAEPTKKMIKITVRPMRSNEDLLSALKKRRLDQKNNKAQVKSVATQEEKQHYEPEVKTIKVKTTAAPKVASHKRFGGHKSTNVKAPVQDDNHAQTIEEPSQKTFKRSNRFSSRQN